MLKRRQMSASQIAAMRPDISLDNEQAVELWNVMNGRIEWNALPLLFGLHGVADPAAMVGRLLAIQGALECDESSAAAAPPAPPPAR